MADMPQLKIAFQSLPEDAEHDCAQGGGTDEDRELAVLVVADEPPAQGQQDSAEQTADRAYCQELKGGEMTEAEDEAEIVFGKAGYQKEHENEKQPLVVHEVVKSIQD